MDGFASAFRSMIEITHSRSCDGTPNLNRSTELDSPFASSRDLMGMRRRHKLFFRQPPSGLPGNENVGIKVNPLTNDRSMNSSKGGSFLMEIQGDGGEKTQLQSPPWMKKRRAMAGMTLEVFLSTDGESPEVDMQSPLAVETPRRVTMMMATKKMMEDDEEGMVTERRHKRMMKNRESAARSRARKQAYTSELENKISRLEEENERLRKQREMENMICYMPPLQMKFQLRRTSSSPL